MGAPVFADARPGSRAHSPEEIGRVCRHARAALDRLRSSQGFGLIELLIAMMVLAIGVMGIVAGFSSGLVALDRAARTSTAGALADRQMEGFRALQFDDIALTSTPSPATDAIYTADDALTESADTSSGTITDDTCTPTVPTCMPVQVVTGPDSRSYRIDTYIRSYCPLGTIADCEGRLVKQITIVVRDPSTTPAYRTLVRETSTFDEAT